MQVQSRIQDVIANLQPANTPRVLLIVESSGAGTGRHVCDLAEGFADGGCEVHVLYGTARADARFYERLKQMPQVHQQALPMHTSIHPSDLKAVMNVRKYMQQHGPFDVIHGHSSKGGAIARLAAIGTRSRAFYTLHGLIMMDPTLSPVKRFIYNVIERVLAKRTCRVIAVSPEEARAAVKVGLGKSRVVTVPNGIGPMRLATRETARSTIGATADEVVIGFVGRLVSQKGIEVLLRAFAQAVQTVPNLRLAMVGGGPLDVEMKSLAVQCGVAEKVSWLGERDARQVWSGFDIFAIASWKEGLPYVVIEAMAAGHPVVATTSAGVEILVENGANGYAVPPGDVNAFAQALVKLSADPTVLATAGMASLERATRFTAERMVDETLAVYRDAGVKLPATDSSEVTIEQVPTTARQLAAGTAV